MHPLSGPPAPLRVLVVDNDADTAESLAEVLTLHGFRAVATTTGEDAASAVAVAPFDAIVADLAMPGVDGYELARRVRGQSAAKRPLLVAVTGCQDVTGRSAAEIGFDLVLLKPVEPAKLVGVLKRFERVLA